MKRAVLTTLCMAVVYLAWSLPQSAASSIRPSSDTLYARPGMDQLLSDILSVTGVSSSFIIREADVLNMEASISKKNRVILYNPDFVDWLYEATHDKWAAATLLAHEIGHHLNGHTIKKGGSKPAVELEADEFAGFVLNKLGATLEQAQEVMKYIATTSGSASHPSRAKRMEAIRKGWEKAANG